MWNQCAKGARPRGELREPRREYGAKEAKGEVKEPREEPSGSYEIQEEVQGELSEPRGR
jgi:hypothetical protein